MAQFNEWNELDGVEGNMMAEPRVFGHDAIAQTPYWNFTISAGGTGYTSDSIGDTGIEANITSQSGGAVTGLTIITKGSGISAGQELTLTGANPGSGLKITISADSLSLVNMPLHRGVVLYSGKATAQDVGLIMESGRSVTFKNVQPGTVVGHKTPVLAIELTSGDDIVAIF